MSVTFKATKKVTFEIDDEEVGEALNAIGAEGVVGALESYWHALQSGHTDAGWTLWRVGREIVESNNKSAEEVIRGIILGIDQHESRKPR